MPAISVSAPGKVILFGEHAVVYGRPALAVPIFEVQAKAIVMANPHAAPGTVRIQAPGIGLEATLADLPEQDPIAVVVKNVLATLNICRAPALTLRITSTIPIAAGLGSGAAVSVAVIRALSTFLGSPLTAEQVSALAYEGEKIHHGTPSGIDNTVITYGKPVYFKRHNADRVTLETFDIQRPFRLVIADSGIPSPTAKVVAEVRQRWQEANPAYERLFDEIGAIAEAARQAIEKGYVEQLGTLMNENQRLLKEMGVSSPELERLISAARQAGASGAKLSGAGQGGNIIALVSDETVEVVRQALQQAGAQRIILTTVKQR